MLRIFIISFFYFFLTISSISQNPDIKRTNHWFFGIKAGLDFSSGTAVADTNGQMSVLEGSATISDINGNLLFYTDGKTVWNKNHQMMLNGDSLGVGKFATPLDCSVIIPKPKDNNTYYIFTADGWENQFKRGMRWHEVNMTGDNGKGEVVSKNNVLFAPCTEQIAATKDATGCGYWVVSHERGNAKYRAYHVTENGIDTNYVQSIVGQDYGIPMALHWQNGGASIKFSPNGKKALSIIYWSYIITGEFEQVQLLDFDNQSGIFSNAFDIPIDTTLLTTFFSPNNQILYVESGFKVAKLYQFDLSSNNISQILQSKINLGIYAPKGMAQASQIGLDGKIYLSVEKLNGIINPPYLSTIENPNILGTNCNVSVGSVFLGAGRATQGLPKFVSQFTVNEDVNNCSLDLEEKKDIEFSIYPNPTNNHIHIQSNIGNIDKYSIYNSIGLKLIENANISELSNIDFQFYTNGVYILQLQTKNGLYVSKFIVHH